jgi:hypothetical protein
MNSYGAYGGSYYAGCAVINTEMNYDFGTEEFSAKVKDSVLFIIDNDGPYLIHCKEGKDRTGIFCAILECFAGGTADEIAKDYMLTYTNFCKVGREDPAYAAILNNNLLKTLCGLYGVGDIYSADLISESREYLLSTGLDEADLLKLGSKLCAEGQGDENDITD